MPSRIKGVAAFVGGTVQFLQSVHGGIPRMHVRGGQREHPANILRPDEMPGGAQEMRAQDCAFLERLLDKFLRGCLHAHAERPERAIIILHMDRAQPGDDLLGFLELACTDALVVEAVSGDVKCAQNEFASQ